MKLITKHRFLMLAAGLALAGGAAEARRPNLSPFMISGMVADAPVGFTAMCRRDAELCAAGMSPTQGIAAAMLAPAVLSDIASPAAQDERAAFDMLRTINSRVNRAIIGRTDIAATGSFDRWERPDAARGYVGDCEDYAIEKRARLLEQGFDPHRLFYAVAYKRGYGLHTVLVARMNAGDYVLDNLSPHVLNWSEVHYSWLRRQSTENPMLWTRVDSGAAPMAAAPASTDKAPA